MVPCWHQKSTKFRPNIDPKRHQKNDRVWDRFFGHLGSILEAKLGPCWHHFRLKWGGAVGCYPLLCCVASFILLFRGFDPVFAPSGLDFGASGPHLGGFLAPFLLFFVPSWRPLGALGRKNGPGYNEIFLPGPAECAKRLNPPAHLWWCDGRVGRLLSE